MNDIIKKQFDIRKSVFEKSVVRGVVGVATDVVLLPINVVEMVVVLPGVALATFTNDYGMTIMNNSFNNLLTSKILDKVYNIK